MLTAPGFRLDDSLSAIVVLVSTSLYFSVAYPQKIGNLKMDSGAIIAHPSKRGKIPVEQLPSVELDDAEVLWLMDLVFRIVVCFAGLRDFHGEELMERRKQIGSLCDSFSTRPIIYSSPLTRMPKYIPSLILRIYTIIMLSMIEGTRRVVTGCSITAKGIGGYPIYCGLDRLDIPDEDQELLREISSPSSRGIDQLEKRCEWKLLDRI